MGRKAAQKNLDLAVELKKLEGVIHSVKTVKEPGAWFL